MLQHMDAFDPSVSAHVGHILAQIEADPEREAIGEADPSAARDTWYPVNAFHTYHVLRLLETFRGRFASEYDAYRTPNGLSLPRMWNQLLRWSRQQLAEQVAMHCAHSAGADTDQLVWLLSSVTQFTRGYRSSLPQQDLLRLALGCIFEAQEATGTWRRHRALFHYKNAGNAYCYVFESFWYLLRLASEPPSEFLRDALYPFLENLIRLTNYADATVIRVGPGGALRAWCSGHRRRQDEPEAWATASVFGYLQALRRLVGLWTRAAALRELQRHPIAVPKGSAAVQHLAARGDTWRAPGEMSVGEQLIVQFVHPVQLLSAADGATSDPDSPVIAERHARSAILFGPPGTSKTTLVRALAGTIGWDYVEIHASDFLAEGLANVHRAAENVFGRILELDRCVVLLDEIDELVRSRHEETDVFGRFLTTALLPKIAHLWEQRRILYFVGTNSLRYFDDAIVRSQRFDNLMFVDYPSFAAKMDKLQDELRRRGCNAATVNVAEDDIMAVVRMLQNRLNGGEDRKSPSDGMINSDECLAKFMLMRWDQIAELADVLVNILAAQTTIICIDRNILVSALGRMPDSRLRRDRSYVEHFLDARLQAVDHNRIMAWKVNGSVPASVVGESIVRRGPDCWLISTGVPSARMLPGCEVHLRPDGLGTVQISSILPR